MKICSVDEMKKIDRESVEIYNIDHLLLMEDAGSAIFSAIVRELGSVRGKKFGVVAGPGNNGGDALVVCRRIYAAGGLVKIIFVGDISKASELCKKNLELAKSIGIEIVHVFSSNDIDKLREVLSWCEYLIVGLIGIGLKGEVRGVYKEVIEEINKYGKPVVSVDIPSGVDGNNGIIRGVAVKSWLTITLGLPKYGNILYPGYSYCGKLYVSFLSYPHKLLEEIPAELNTPVPPPERIKWGHKGVFGKFLAISGSRYYYGAPYYVSYSFLKAGGGYSRLAAPRSIIPYIAAKCSEVVYIPLEETSEGSIALKNFDQIIKLIEEYGIDIVAIGSGVSLNEETQELVKKLVEHIDRPIIVDGDGITAISKNIDILKKRKISAILTPHLVEFSRLTNIDIKDIQENPVEIVRKTCKELNTYIVLKGAHSIIGYPNGYIYINMTGNPGMAKAGSGDVLTGTIAAMYGIGYKDLGLATRIGVLVHGLAGDLAAQDLGEDGVTPDDILNYLPKAMKILRENTNLIIEKYFPAIV